MKLILVIYYITTDDDVWQYSMDISMYIHEKYLNISMLVCFGFRFKSQGRCLED